MLPLRSQAAQRRGSSRVWADSIAAQLLSVEARHAARTQLCKAGHDGPPDEHQQPALRDGLRSTGRSPSVQVTGMPAPCARALLFCCLLSELPWAWPPCHPATQRAVMRGTCWQALSVQSVPSPAVAAAPLPAAHLPDRPPQRAGHELHLSVARLGRLAQQQLRGVHVAGSHAIEQHQGGHRACTCACVTHFQRRPPWGSLRAVTERARHLSRQRRRPQAAAPRPRWPA